MMNLYKYKIEYNDTIVEFDFEDQISLFWQKKQLIKINFLQIL